MPKHLYQMESMDEIIETVGKIYRKEPIGFEMDIADILIYFYVSLPIARTVSSVLSKLQDKLHKEVQE